MAKQNKTPSDSPVLYTIHSSLSFVEALARGVLQKYGDTPQSLSEVRILVPTRRSARALLEAFVGLNEGDAMLLPRVSPIGDIDEDEETFALASQSLFSEISDDASVPEAISNHERHFILTELILKARDSAGFAVANEGQALELAYELAGLLDQVQREDLGFDGLADLVDERYAAHWQETLSFLQIITDHWPQILQERELIDPMDRRNRLMAALAAHWQATQPETPIIVAGSTGSIPATAQLMHVIARLPEGAIVLPGLDTPMPDDAWEALDVSHPQWGMKRLLEGIGASRHEVEPWPLEDGPQAEPGRVQILSAAMLPAAQTGDWVTGTSVASDDIAAVHLMDAPGLREEAGAISLMMREVTESPEKSCALVTPDRNLARRVSAELKRWGIDVDDSAGEPLESTSPGTVLRLLVRVVAERYAPVPLLELLKHPLVAAGHERSAFIQAVRQIEIDLLRGPRIAGGLDAMATALQKTPDLANVIVALKAAFAPLEGLFQGSEASLSALLKAHVACAEALARTEETSGADILWSGNAGDAAATLIAEVMASADAFPAMAPSAYPSLFLSLIRRGVVRPLYGTHPRLFIWGPQEARLQSADRIILGGLNEGSWPQLPQTNPWMSRPMQADFGLPLPERRIGLSAHDFVQAASRSEVFLTRSTKVEGALSIPSRWLQRLEMYLKASGIGLDREQGEAYLSWYLMLDRPERIRPVDRPKPCPPLDARPKRLSVTQIETLIRDPYAIYARHILELRPLAPVDEDPGAADRGTVIHSALEEFANRFPDELPDDPLAALTEVGQEIFSRLVDNANVRAFWWPRFLRAAEWFVGYERERRQTAKLAATEARGEITFEVGDGSFKLTCSADRLDRNGSGRIDVIDYKTGSSPSDPQVVTGLAPQLPLEAAILKAGGFKEVGAVDAGDLIYVELKGGTEPGKARTVDADANALADEKLQGLKMLLSEYTRIETPYLSRVIPFSERFSGDYDHLARVLEQLSGSRGSD